MRDARLRLHDILEAILTIEAHSQGGRGQFESDVLTQSFVIRQLQIIGEAARHVRQLKPEWLASRPDVPWDDVVGMRDRLVHGYFDIRLDLVWETIEIGLPALKRAVTALLETKS